MSAGRERGAVATRPMRFALIGDPVSHSKSPGMHAAAFRALRLPHTYEAIRATPQDLPALVDALRAGTFDGFNVTVPHKRRVLSVVDEVERSARLAGAANTLVANDDGTVVAYNTDTLALAEEITRLAPERGLRGGPASQGWEGHVGLVLGSGGAARGAVVALASELGASRVVVRARAFDDAAAADAFLRELRDGLDGTARIEAQPFRPDAEVDREAMVVVQATSAGMIGADPGETVAGAVAWSELPARSVALDVVYAPPETAFLRAAAAHGIRCANGLGMLARQGALAFELWLGVPAPYNAMLATLV